MKKLLLIIAATVVGTAAAQPKTVELPLTMHDGYGGISAGFTGVPPDSNDPNDPWFKTRVQILRLPEGLTQVQSGDIDTNLRQSTYQNYLAGTITPQWYASLQKGWDWTPDTLALSKTPVRTKIAFAFGLDAGGVRKFVLDANGNLDLSDDAQFTPIDMSATDGVANRDSLLAAHGVRVRVETFTHNKIQEVEAPVFVLHFAMLDNFFQNIGRHATAEYRGQQIVVSSRAFSNLSFDNPVVRLADSEETCNKGEYINIGGEALKIVGVDTNKSVLLLERVESQKLYSSQKGFAAHPFSGEEFTTHTPVSLESLRGKYVFVDFWAVTCGPCIREMPNLRALYDKTSRERFEIVGIVGNSNAERLTPLIEKHGIVWPQILSDEICKLYGVSSYPTTLLIDPNGVIVAKNLRGAEVEKRVLDLLGE